MTKFTVMEVATRLGVHKSFVRRVLLSGEMKGHQESIWVISRMRPVWFVEELDLRAFEDARLQRLSAKALPETAFASLDELSKERAVELAWLAGLVDGEGYIGLSQKTMRSRGDSGKIWIGYTPSLVVAMNSEKACRRAHQIAQVGQVFLKQILLGKEHWCWRARNRDAANALQQIRPFLVEKGYQAELVIKGAAINASYQSERNWRERLPQRAEELKALAHELFALHGNAHKHL